MVTVGGGARQKGKKLARENEQLSLHKAKNPYRPPINHEKIDEELSKIELEMRQNHQERLEGADSGSYDARSTGDESTVGFAGVDQ
ncbi:hypothetical protein LWI28_011746 [Acer negundo]|uniref:Uncharacterized protein n=1 Tax=Acer negundo TaxID=4023 RepID=A0AAD5IQV9_ACENE|nr:hypothetical protein LWI28_011746 [Acer negundo]